LTLGGNEGYPAAGRPQTGQGRGHHSQAFAGIDTLKSRNAAALRRQLSWRMRMRKQAQKLSIADPVVGPSRRALAAGQASALADAEVICGPR